ncbi:hypothetical protein AMAG_17810 [Allomyces macrogynus ATCC 38327]|uniref:Uncharacterized protein n=1 Tax=Allomyces macrogynus (strain ATCC 38327) TaxID=578462 RepID=A0A0L0RZX9_ALLM3|nr:hypothetical protein, variant [Allomyces macrogynus ATCC 38327]KNE55706.1 hypothetical protein AMAG_17810 [Allomyces macrogynus ATCC 38327]|eukprot:KNE55705.1 hypothetical protein, variant [Allomyces macrogynus ATCC 38327]
MIVCIFCPQSLSVLYCQHLCSEAWAVTSTHRRFRYLTSDQVAIMTSSTLSSAGLGAIYSIKHSNRLFDQQLQDAIQAQGRAVSSAVTVANPTSESNLADLIPLWEPWWPTLREMDNSSAAKQDRPSILVLHDEVNPPAPLLLIDAEQGPAFMKNAISAAPPRQSSASHSRRSGKSSFDPDSALCINLLDVLLTYATLARLLRGDLVSDALAVCQAAWALSPVLAATLQDFEYEGIEEWVETAMETAKKNPSYYLSRDRLPLVLADAVALFSNLDTASRAIKHLCEPFARISGDPAAAPAVLRVVSQPVATERALGRHRRRAAVTARRLRFYGEYVEWLVTDPEGQEEHARVVQLLCRKPAVKVGPDAGSFAVQTVGGEDSQDEKSADGGVLSVFEALSLTKSGGSSVMRNLLIEML